MTMIICINKDGTKCPVLIVFFFMKGIINMNNRANNAMSEFLLKIQLIVSNTEFKNKTEAMKYETIQSKMDGEAYVRAINKTDIFESYKYDEVIVYDKLEKDGFDDIRIMAFLRNPAMIPQKIKDELLTDARERYISTYIEMNKYYANLAGMPFIGNDNFPADEVILIPDGFYDIYSKESEIYKNQPIHEMPLKYQELFMNSPFYSAILEAHPNAEYLKYIGSNMIPIEISRGCKDGDIMRINTTKLTTYHEMFGNVTVSSDIIHTFISSYKKCRDYVFGTLRGDFSNIYANYDSFIRFLTIYLGIGMTLNELSRFTNTMIHENSVAANNFFMLYGLPSSIMEGSSLTDFLKRFRLLLQDKGTNVVYRVKDLIGYEYTDIYTLIMVKQQVFKDGIPVYTYDEKTGERIPVQKIVFRRFGTTDDNTSYFKFKEEHKEFSLEEITSGDPRWWNTPEVEQILTDMNYTLSNSKYIQLDTHMSLSDVWWQCTILIRGLLDKREETQFTKLQINTNINGTSQISLFDAILTLIIIMNWHLVDANGRHFDGYIYLPNSNGRCVDMLFNGLYRDGSPKSLVEGDPYLIAGFNFNIREENGLFYNILKTYDYIEPDKFLPMLDAVLDMGYTNIGDALMHEVKQIYDYLVEKLREAKNIHEFRQVSETYNKLFLVDPIRDWYDKSTFDPDVIIMDEYNITEKDLASLKSFYHQSEERIVVPYNGATYDVNIYEILNNHVETVKINGIYPFRDDEFVNAFSDIVLNKFNSPSLLASQLSEKIKANYKAIINDKVIIDVGNSEDGPKTFESLLFRNNQSLYRYISSIKSDGHALVILMRNIIKSLEAYTNSKLSALEFRVLGVEDYFNILKEVISYFKSYMVEFSSSEISIVFDGLFDYGGNSNMINLYDEITNIDTEMLPRESLSLHDVAFINARMPAREPINLHDEAIFRHETKYSNIKKLGYEIWYDYKDKITKTPWDIDDDTYVLVNIVPDGKGGNRVIINCNNLDVIPPNYVGHK